MRCSHLLGRVSFAVDLQPHQDILGGREAFVEIVCLKDKPKTAAQAHQLGLACTLKFALKQVHASALHMP